MKTREEKLEYSRQYKKNNRDKINKYRADNKERHLIWERRYQFKKKYGITLDQYQNMFNLQEGKCAICGIHQDELTRALYIDHDHCTENIRGLLCHKCNSILGYVNDDINLLENAIKYLIKYQ
jgi:hypothetical protein